MKEVPTFSLYPLQTEQLAPVVAFGPKPGMARLKIQS